ncbi:Uncharacterised protein [Achromobacter ruhlandii]|nr:Uncharacterised protein [Achromobacter ruhlandii]CUJ96398.1 Uncharacterised protein [Achromobacter ruhlandii]
MATAFGPVAVRFACQDIHVAPRNGNQGPLLAGDSARGATQIAASLQAHVAGRGDGAADILLVTLPEIVAGIAYVVLLLGNGDGAQRQVPAGDHGGLTILAAVADPGRDQLGVTPRRGQQEAIRVGDVETGHAIQVGPAEVAASGPRGAAASGADHVEVASGAEPQRRTGIQRAADTVDVGAGAERHGIAGDAAAENAQVVAAEIDHRASRNGAGINEIAFQVEIDGAGGQQGAVAVDVARLYADVDLRHQGARDTAVGQRHVAFDQPDDIAGELGHLPGAERHAGTQIPFLGVGDACIQQCLVLRVVAGVVREESAARQLAYLVAHQLLLVKAIA